MSEAAAPPEEMPPPSRRPLRVMLGVCLGLTLVFGVVKVHVQKAHPPGYALKAYNNFEGYVSIDRFSHRAEALKRWMVGEPVDLAGELNLSRHPVSLLVPAMVAALAIVTGSIPLSFMALSLAATVAFVLLVGRLASRIVPQEGGSAALVAGVLAASHCCVVRNAGQLILDVFVAAAMAAVALLSLSWCERAGRATTAGLLVLQLGAVFIKVTALPILGIPAFICLGRGGPGSFPRAVKAGLLLGVAPLAAAALVLWAIGALDSGLFDLQHAAKHYAAKSTLLPFAIEMLLLFQAFPVILALGRGWREPRRRGLGLAFLAVLIATWCFHLPATSRLYLPIAGVLAVLASPVLLRRLAPRHLLAALLLHAGLNYGVSIAGLVLSL